MWLSIVAAQLIAADQCEPPRVRDTAPLVAAIAQDRVLAQAFTKAATSCAEPGEACTAARLECSTLLASTIQKQVSFDEGVWLRDMLLPYNGGTYPMGTVFGAAALAADASCNVEVAVLNAASGRRTAQAARRDAIYKEYGKYSAWSQTQLQKCKERVAAAEQSSAAAKAESERIAAASAAVAAAEAAKKKQEEDAARARAEAERKAKEAADAEARRQQELKDAEAKRQQEAKDAAEKEAKRREEAEKQAKADREAERKRAEERQDQLLAQQKKEREEAEAARKKEKEDEEAARREAEAKRFVTDRDSKVSQQRALKEKLVKDAEENLKRAKDEEALKKQAAVDAVSSSPAIAAAAVAEAAAAEKARAEAEKRLVTARQQSDAILIDDSHERRSGQIFAAGGGGAVGVGGAVSFALGAQAGATFGFWGTAPPEGMASGLELRLWGRYWATLGPSGIGNFDSMITARYYFGHFGVGLAGEIRLDGLTALRGGAGPSIAVAFIDNRETTIVLGVSYLPVGNTIDVARVEVAFDIGWKYLDVRVLGGTTSVAGATGAPGIGWNVAAMVGPRLAW